MSLKNKETPKKPRAPTSAWQKSQKHQQHCFSTMLQPAPGESGHTQTRCVYELNQALLERGTAGQGTPKLYKLLHEGFISSPSKASLAFLNCSPTPCTPLPRISYAQPSSARFHPTKLTHSNFTFGILTFPWNASHHFMPLSRCQFHDKTPV